MVREIARPGRSSSGRRPATARRVSGGRSRSSLRALQRTMTLHTFRPLARSLGSNYRRSSSRTVSQSRPSSVSRASSAGAAFSSSVRGAPWAALLSKASRLSRDRRGDFPSAFRALAPGGTDAAIFESSRPLAPRSRMALPEGRPRSRSNLGRARAAPSETTTPGAALFHLQRGADLTAFHVAPAKSRENL